MSECSATVVLQSSGAFSASSSLTCEHCGDVFQNVAAARYHAAKLCNVLHPIGVPSTEDSPLAEGSFAGDFEPNPEWPKLGFRGRVAALLMAAAREWYERGEERKALRLRRKAIRFANCGRLGRSAVCSLFPFEHKFYAPHDCGTDFCAKCAQEQRRSLFVKYLQVILRAIGGGIPKDFTLARVTFSLRSDGSVITPERGEAI